MQLNSFVFALLCWSTSITAQTIVPTKPGDPDLSPRESLRKSLFPQTLEKPGCLPRLVKPNGSIEGVDAELGSFIKQMVTVLGKGDRRGTAKLFHPRLKVTKKKAEVLFYQIKKVGGVPFQVSAHKAWALNTTSETLIDEIVCEDGITITPLYGHPLQMAVWLQVMGAKELLKLFVVLVPSADRWHIGMLYRQQWTHDGRDYIAWAEEGMKNVHMGHKIAGYIKFDLAENLSKGEPHFVLNHLHTIRQTKTDTFADGAWLGEWQKILRQHTVVNVHSLLVPGGAGILLRTLVKKDTKSQETEAFCEDIRGTLAVQPWANQLEGVRCNFLRPGEDPNKDGALGGAYLSFRQDRP